ncbi:protein-L-histidine N-pros-methyltransferase-like [Penaeus chinensis]|uniref:protein-L-histidine N-pros-methyltransferase-like n=1 Tax=Penaeus chinensis TaxID=139456 RepID=UPI001FB7CA27|nr:protein-L-histidine N-pros-methyltransferase-like [Penaeus chinensis]
MIGSELRPPILLVVSVVAFAMAGAGAKPYLRSNLARTIHARMMTDGRLRNMNLAKLYAVDELALADNVRERFVQLSTDEETRSFLDNCFEQSEWVFTQIWHSVAKALLGMFMTQTSING